MDELYLVFETRRIKNGRMVKVYVNIQAPGGYILQAFQATELYLEQQYDDLDAAKLWANTWINE